MSTTDTDTAISNGQTLLFEIKNAYIVDKEGVEKKHVVYTLQVRNISHKEDEIPATIDRRYTHFYNLFNNLKSDLPDLMTSVTFPRKVLIGNFNNSLITTRSTGFESLLKHVSCELKLRSSSSLLNFLQDSELQKVKQYMEEKNYDLALPLLENNFRLLNKVYTDRSSPVLIALCRLLGCCILMPGSPNAEKWADLALHRYKGVSDSDLLYLYVPLLQVCIKIWWQHGRENEGLKSRLENLKKQGHRINSNESLLDAITVLEQNQSSQNATASF